MWVWGKGDEGESKKSEQPSDTTTGQTYLDTHDSEQTLCEKRYFNETARWTKFL